MSDIEAAFEEHFRYVYLYILKLSRDEALAEEITSESFLKALSSIDSFKGDCDIRVWLCQIAKNCYFTHRNLLVVLMREIVTRCLLRFDILTRKERPSLL